MFTFSEHLFILSVDTCKAMRILPPPMDIVIKQLGSETAATLRWQPYASQSPIGGARLCANNSQMTFDRFDAHLTDCGEPMT